MQYLPLSSEAASYYRARYYDPQAGRFLNEDPVGFDASINFYPYVANLPTTLIDPLGLQEQSPGGPWHPPTGTQIACKGSDDCSTLSFKIGVFKQMLASHIAWDLANQTNRHANDISEIQNGLDNCIALHRAKCTDKPPCPPVLVPDPSPERSPSRVPMPVPSTAIPSIIAIGLIIIIIIFSPLGA